VGKKSELKQRERGSNKTLRRGESKSENLGTTTNGGVVTGAFNGRGSYNGGGKGENGVMNFEKRGGARKNNRKKGSSPDE